MRKIIFLDVDGVLNDLHVLSTREELGKDHLLNLKMLVAATKCDIVLSSSWRISNEWKTILRVAFEEHGIPLWIDQTPRLTNDDFSTIPRRQEIIMWLEHNVSEDALVVVLDDEWDADIKNHNLPNVKDKFCHTCMNYGLTPNRVQEAIDFLKNNF
jgi:hypothetical protein